MLFGVWFVALVGFVSLSLVVLANVGCARAHVGCACSRSLCWVLGDTVCDK